MSDFYGVVPAIITPMTADGKLNEKTLKKNKHLNY